MKLSALMIGGFSAVAMVVAGCQTMPVPSRYKGEASNKGEAVAIAKVGCARKLDKYEYANQLNWKAEQMGGGRWYARGGELDFRGGGTPAALDVVLRRFDCQQ